MLVALLWLVGLLLFSLIWIMWNTNKFVNVQADHIQSLENHIVVLESVVNELNIATMVELGKLREGR